MGGKRGRSKYWWTFIVFGVWSILARLNMPQEARSHILFTSWEQGGIALADDQGDKICLLTPDSVPALSPQGDRLAFVRYFEDSRTYGLYVMSLLDDSEPLLLTDEASYQTVPIWSRDGTRIAFVAETAGNSQRYNTRFVAVWIVNADGGDLRRVGGALTGFFEVLWSFDGQSLFYWGWTTGTNTGLHRVDVAASEVHFYPDEGGFNTMNFSWSPDGSQFAYLDEDADGEVALFLRDEATGQTRVLSREYIPYRPPVWSPDGTHLILEVYRYASSGPHDVELYILELATGHITPIPGDGEISRWPVWSPDGRYLVYAAGVFSSDDPFSSHIVVVDQQGHSVRRLAHSEGEARAYTWTMLPGRCD